VFQWINYDFVYDFVNEFGRITTMRKEEQQAITAIRILAAEGVQKANSGHPGMPIGAAPMAYALWRQMKQNPQNPSWPGRDRFVLSAGHASMLEYALLHFFGYGMSIEEIKSFRQWGSKTPGHPEYGHTTGVEATTGPLGQGVAMAVGMAMAEAHLAAIFNRDGFPVVDNFTYTIAGDGCMMEGASAEAASMAGSMELGRLILLYDSNNITIEGETSLAFREDVGGRFAAYGWQVLYVEDGEDVDAIAEAIETAKQETKRPSLIIVKTEIARGTPKAGKSSAHGEPLGEENIKAMKAFYGWESEEAFQIPDGVYAHFAAMQPGFQAQEDQWNALFAAYEKAYPDLAQKWKDWQGGKLPVDFSSQADFWDFSDKTATRAASGTVLNRLVAGGLNLFGGSADLGPSNKTTLKDKGDFGPGSYEGVNIHFGVRELAMACACNGMALYGGLRPFCATFFVFSDYVKPALRLSALMKLPVVYVLTHDSIGVGEDGPTHQPVEQLAALRATPNTVVFRPADGKETAAGYLAALAADGPTVLVLSRQNLPFYESTGEGAMRGGYILRDAAGEPDVILLASGSEVELVMKACAALEEKGVAVRVVSMPSFELFEAQEEAYREMVLPRKVRARVAVEAGSSFGWAKYVGLDGETVALDHFGASAPAPALFRAFGFTPEHVAETAMRVIKCLKA
jgi:transketolase